MGIAGALTYWHVGHQWLRRRRDMRTVGSHPNERPTMAEPDEKWHHPPDQCWMGYEGGSHDPTSGT